MAFLTLIRSKILLAICNFLLLVTGFTLVTGGMLVLFDTERVLLSKLLSIGPFPTLPHPLLYYIGLGFAVLGLVLATAGVLGCWASCLQNYYVISLYFVIIMALLVGEFAVYAIGLGWPHCFGLNLDAEALTKALQSNYGSAGNEQFTAAVDLVQTTFNCCGIESATEYDTSLWRLQGLGPSLAVPLTCCKVDDSKIPKSSYLDPQPVNVSLCQALETNRHEGFRHIEGCKEFLEQWYREHYLMFLGVGVVVVIVEFTVLLSTILTCTRIYHHNQDVKRNNEENMRQESQAATLKENYYHQRSPVGAYSNDTYALTNSFRQNYKLTHKV